MSAPLVINLRDGSVWERRGVTPEGVALYALAGSCKCPEYLLATEAELAAQGIAGTADVLPVPVGSKPRPPSVEELAGQIAELTQENERLQRVADREHKAFIDTHDALNLVVQDAQRLAAENGVSELVAERNRLRDQVERAGRRVESSRKANRELRSQVAALRAERHTANEALDDAVQELRARREDAPATDTLPAWLHWRFGKHGQRWDSLDVDDRSYWEHHAEAVRRAVARNGFKPGGNGAVLALGVPDAGRSADKLTALLAPSQALREDAAAAPCCHLHKPSCCDPEDCGPCCMACPTCPVLVRQRAEGSCTGCVVDHAPGECGYRPEAGAR